MYRRTPDRLAEPRPPAAPIGSPGLRVLLVEDDDEDARARARSLEAAPAGQIRLTVERVPDLASALDAVRTGRPDACLLDLDLPDSRGLETLRGLVAAAPRLPVVVLGGGAGDEVARRALGEGAEDVLVKDRAPRDLVARALHHAVQRRADRLALRESEQRFRRLVETSREGIWILDPEGRITYANPRLAGLLGEPQDALVGRPAAGFVHPEDRTPDFLAGVADGSKIEPETELRLKRADDSVAWVVVSSAPLPDAFGRCAGVLGMLTDTTERRHIEGEVERLSLYDTLTGLPNRTLFENRLGQALKRRSRLSSGVAVVVVDLDRFKVVNDTVGRPVGDALLCMVGQRLRDRLREEDTVARLGGDQFALLLENVSSPEDARMVAERVSTAFDEPYEMMETRVRITSSLGIVMSPDEHAEPGDLIRYGEVAMYRAKETEGTDLHVFDPTRDFGATQRLRLYAELEEAIRREQLVLHYQPIVELESGRIVGVEALVRWAHPHRGFIFPGEFLALAEESGVIVDLEEWVLEQAATRVSAWRRDVPGAESLRLSVNVSPRCLGPELVVRVRRVLAATDLPAEALQLEVTESVALKGDGALSELRGLGVHVAVDDVGKGHSSLEYLTRLRVDELKVDRSFVEGLGSSSRDSAVVEAVLLLGERLGLRVTAEGIEREEQWRRLRALGCGLGQGYLFCRPLDADELRGQLEAEGLVLEASTAA